MGKTDPRVDQYIAMAADFAKPILTHIRKVVHTACPDVEETMKWSFPHFDYKDQMMCSMAAFTAAAARKTFDAFSPSQKREYVEWLTEAKTDATRQKRMTTAVEWLAEGKSRNWKYEPT